MKLDVHCRMELSLAFPPGTAKGRFLPKADISLNAGMPMAEGELQELSPAITRSGCRRMPE